MYKDHFTLNINKEIIKIKRQITRVAFWKLTIGLIEKARLRELKKCSNSAFAEDD